MTNNIHFMHIRKTGGTSFSSYLRSQFSLAEICPERSQFELQVKHKDENLSQYLRQFKLIHGHFYTVPQLVGPDWHTVTILRHPIARTLSELNHILSAEDDLFHARAKGRDRTEILGDPEFKRPFENSMTRHLVAAAGLGYEAINDERRLNTAKRFLQEIKGFGFTEQLGTSTWLIARQLGWEYRPPQRLNTAITESGQKITEAPPYVDQLYSLNNLDIALYEFAQNLFDQRVTEALASQPGAGVPQPQA